MIGTCSNQCFNRSTSLNRKRDSVPFFNWCGFSNFQGYRRVIRAEEKSLLSINSIAFFIWATLLDLLFPCRRSDIGCIVTDIEIGDQKFQVPGSHRHRL